MDREYRSMSSKLEIRADTDEDLVIEGYFALFDDETELWNGYFEKINRSAFDKTLKGEPDIRALFDHDTAKILGRTKNNTLVLRVDKKGLFGRIKINRNDTEAMNLYERVKRGDIDQCSFGFSILDQDVREGNNGSYHVEIRDLELFEVSVVTFPAYSNTSVSARKKDFENQKKNNHEAWKKRMKEKLKQC
ncbi:MULTISPECIES: HK97 family phage prohead protease [Helcococcus]|uniref:HK97 family phage prohead protease n=1 Tax=Helcococcus bovis TaxID=3153252 RepID=A0ABW9F8G3_9FIRM